jgi:hypothetical protein
VVESAADQTRRRGRKSWQPLGGKLGTPLEEERTSRGRSRTVSRQYSEKVLKTAWMVETTSPPLSALKFSRKPRLWISEGRGRRGEFRARARESHEGGAFKRVAPELAPGYPEKIQREGQVPALPRSADEILRRSSRGSGEGGSQRWPARRRVRGARRRTLLRLLKTA